MDSRISIDAQIKKKLFEKHKGRCYYCGRPITWVEATIDHVKPLAKGGSNDVTNFVLSCTECNCLKSDKELPEFRILIQSVMANAIRYMDRNLYNIETGELKFFGEKQETEELSSNEIIQLNSLMKPKAPKKYEKYLTKTTEPSKLINQRLNLSDINSLPIDDPYSNPELLRKPFPDEEWTNNNSYVEKPFKELVDTTTPVLLQEDAPPQKTEINTIEVEENVEKIEENLSEPNFIIVQDEKIWLRKVVFDFPKGLSVEAKHFLNEVKRLIENSEDLNEDDSIRIFYDRMNKDIITNKIYTRVSKELMKKDIINKHKKFRPRCITITRFEV